MVSYKHLKLPDSRKYHGPAPIHKRIFALIIDLLIVNFIIVTPFTGIVAKLFPDRNQITYEFLMSNQEVAAVLYLVLFFISLLILLYFVLFETKMGQTIGKMILNIYVVKIPQSSVSDSLSLLSSPGQKIRFKAINLNDESSKIDLLSALLRNLIVIPFFPFIALWIIDPFYMFFNKRGQRFLEILSSTVTIEYVHLN
jgi:uncharacterized RDD family membrane protein YckC